MTAIINLDKQGCDHVITTQIAAELRAGRIVCLPSDTCYSLSCLASSEESTQRLRQLKCREASKPFLLLVRDLEMAMSYAGTWDSRAAAIAEAFWPGPISIVVPFQQSESRPIAHSGDTIAVRVPASSILIRIMKDVDCPLWSTSANKPFSKPPASPKQIPLDILNRVALLLDAGELPQPRPSTVIDLSKKRPIVLREGPITAAEIISRTSVRLEL